MTDDFKGHHSKSEMKREEIMNKPREWWIDVSKPSPDIKELGETRKFEGVHVIEYFAYKTACKERDDLKHKLSCAQHYLDDHTAACQRADLAERERDEARAEIEQLEMTCTMRAGRLEVQQTLLTETAAALEFAHKHLESMNNYSVVSGARHELLEVLTKLKSHMAGGGE